MIFFWKVCQTLSSPGACPWGFGGIPGIFASGAAVGDLHLWLQDCKRWCWLKKTSIFLQGKHHFSIWGKIQFKCIHSLGDWYWWWWWWCGEDNGDGGHQEEGTSEMSFHQKQIVSWKIVTACQGKIFTELTHEPSVLNMMEKLSSTQVVFYLLCVSNWSQDSTWDVFEGALKSDLNLHDTSWKTPPRNSGLVPVMVHYMTVPQLIGERPDAEPQAKSLA